MNSEFSFYNFAQTIESGCDYCDLSIPVCFGSDIAFFTDQSITEVAYCAQSGDLIKVAESVVYGTGNKYAKLSDDLTKVLALGDCFRLRINGTYFSNTLRYVEYEADIALLEYRCNEAQFGFDYDVTTERNKVRLPLRLFNPKFPQDEKVYVTSTGQRKVQYAKIDKEWELETEYLPESIHEKIIVALAHDTVVINDEEVTKSAEYDIDWAEYINLDTDCTGKLAKATCKVQQNRTLRNSNCK
jgi:hypothetical protein